MPTKTYTRQVVTLFTRDEMQQLLRDAHNHCKVKVKPTYHKIGQQRQRTIVSRSRREYLDCIKEYINQKVQERVKSIVGGGA